VDEAASVTIDRVMRAVWTISIELRRTTATKARLSFLRLFDPSHQDVTLPGTLEMTSARVTARKTTISAGGTSKRPGSVCKLSLARDAIR
jgi:hypothetical protein